MEGSAAGDDGAQERERERERDWTPGAGVNHHHPLDIRHMQQHGHRDAGMSSGLAKKLLTPHLRVNDKVAVNPRAFDISNLPDPEQEKKSRHAMLYVLT